MNNGEFYLSKEDNYIGENKSFPAEIYRKVREENSLGNEAAYCGKELTTLQRKSTTAKTNKDGSRKTVIDRIFNSVKSIATTATVAVSAIVVTSTVISNSVNVELIDLNVGSDYVEYEMNISDMTDEDECYVLIGTDGEDNIETEISGNGIHKTRVEGLMPQTEYILSVITRDSVLGDITHFEQKLTTQGHQDHEAHSPPDTYTGEYQIPIIDITAIDWNTNRLAVPIVFENVENKYYYKLTVFNKNGNEHEVIRGSESGTAAVNLSTENDIYKFVFEIYGVGTSDEKLLISHDLGAYEVARPQATVKDILLAGENSVRINIACANVPNVTLHIEYEGGEPNDIPLSEADISRGYTEITVPETVKNITATPIVDFGSYTLIGDALDRRFDANLEIESWVNLNNSNMSIDFYVRAITNGATALRVICDQDESITGNYEIYDGMATVYYSKRSQMSLTLYLTDSTGAVLSNEIIVSVDTTYPQTLPEYTMNYTNPGDIGVTYNENGTANIYVYTGFECADESYYCLVTLGKYVIKTREKVAVLTNVPNVNYPISYSVCFERDGIRYSVLTVTPSGTVNEVSFLAYCSLSGNVFTISVNENHNLDLNTVKAVASDGSVIQLTESDFEQDVNGEQTATAVFNSSLEYVTLYVMIAPHTKGLELVGEYEGSVYMLYEEDIYPD